MSLATLLEGKKVFTTGGVDVQTVKEAEEALNIQFPTSYKDLLLNYGALAVGTHEIAALGVEGYLNVVELTKQERKFANGQLDSYFVVENLNTEGLLIVLDEQCKVYEYKGHVLEEIYTDFLAYLEKEVL